MSKRKANKERQITGKQREAARQKHVRQEALQHRETEEMRTERPQETRQDRKKELERLILEYTEELAEDINLRLLALQDIGPAGFRRGRYHTGDVLYVESIIVTDVRYPEEKKRGSSLTEFGKKVRNIWKQGRATENCSDMED